MSEQEWVVVHVAQGGIEEEQVRGFLTAHDIPVEVRGEALRHTHAMVLDGLGAVEIHVPAEHAEDARHLLELVARGELELDEEHE